MQGDVAYGQKTENTHVILEYNKEHDDLKRQMTPFTHRVIVRAKQGNEGKVPSQYLAVSKF